jgi:hypothetical protein
VRDLIQDALAREVFESPASRQLLEEGIAAIERGATTPYRLVEDVLEASRRRFAEKQS